MKKIYAVSVSFFSDDGDSKNNGSRILKVFKNLDNAKAFLKVYAEEWKESGYDSLAEVSQDKWHPGCDFDEKESRCEFDSECMYAYAYYAYPSAFDKIQIEKIVVPEDGQE